MRINLVGQIYGCMGIPNHTRDLFRALQNNGMGDSITVYPLSPNFVDYDMSGFGRIADANWQQQAEKLRGITFIFWTPDIYPQILRNIVREDSIVIGYPIFEWTSFTKAFRDSLDQMDYIAVSSTWAKNTLISNGILDSKIVIIPAGVNSEYFHSEAQWDNRIGNSEFLYIAKNEKRKSVKECLENFHKAFPNGEKTLDVLLTDPHAPSFDAQATINSLVGPEIGRTFNLIRRPDKISEMVALYNSHAYILVPSRAGGTELPMIEAAATGCLPIVTNYGGMAHYLPDDYKYLIPVKTMLPMYDDRWYKPSIDWGSWAEPDWDAFRTLLQEASTESHDDFIKQSASLKERINTLFNYPLIAKSSIGFMRGIYIEEEKLDRKPPKADSSS